MAGRQRESAIQREIGQTRPFRSVEQEATVALLRTASVLSRALGRVLEPYGISLPQYNALRIIRGAGSGGIPTLDIRERMIDQGTTITRLLDKLEAARLIRRERSEPDRRQVMCFLTPAGKALLERLDAPMDRADDEAMAGLNHREIERLLKALEAIRAANAELGAPRCTRGAA